MTHLSNNHNRYLAKDSSVNNVKGECSQFLVKKRSDDISRCQNIQYANLRDAIYEQILVTAASLSTNIKNDKDF
jgi:hypothetical protein